MIDFPSSPTNGQVVTLAGNQYTYNLAKTQWQVTTPSVSTNLGGGSLGTIPYQSALNTTAMLATTGGVNDLGYLSIKDSTASPTLHWYAGTTSTNVSNNTNWIFTVAPIIPSTMFFMF